MKVAILSESPVDEAAIRILVEGLLQHDVELPSMPPLRSRGYDAALASLRTVVRHLHYQTDAEALVLVVDSDRSVPHEAAHDALDQGESACRLCRIGSIIHQEQGRLSPRPSGDRLKTACGLAVPTLEAWLRCGLDPHVNEATWCRALASRESPYDGRRLKRDVYGVDAPPLELAVRVASEQARRLVDTGELPHLEQLFPGGFGSLAADVRGW